MTNLKRIEIWITNRSSQRWFSYGLLFLITVLAAALRFYKLGAWSFWIDEIYTVNHAMAHFSTPQLILDHLPPNRNWVPVSVVLTAQVLNHWGINELNARLVAAIIGTLTLPVLYFPLIKIFNPRVALITVFLLAISPWHIEWSQNARGYTSLLLFYSLALFAFYFAIEKDRPYFLLLFFLFLYLASSERLIALFLLPVLLIYLLALKFLPFEKPLGLRARNLYILLSPALLIGAYHLYGSIQNGESVFGSIVNEIVTTFFGKPIENPFTQITFLVFKLGIPLFVLTIFCAFYLWFQKNRQGLLFVAGAIVPFSLVVLVTPFMFTEERYAFAMLPSWIIVVAIAIDELLVRMKRPETLFALAFLVVLLGDSMGANLMYFHTNHGNRRDWRGAFALVQENMQEGDIVVSTWPELGNYYLKQDVLLWQDVNEESILNSENRVWFVVIPDMAWYSGTEDFYWWVSHYTRMIKTIYIRTVDNTNLEIYVYDPDISAQIAPVKDPSP
jgi:mannosyltransferase